MMDAMRECVLKDLDFDFGYPPMNRRTISKATSAACSAALQFCQYEGIDWVRFSKVYRVDVSPNEVRRTVVVGFALIGTLA